MEQRNISEEKIFTLKQVLEDCYFEYLLRCTGIKEEDIEGITRKEKKNKILSMDEAQDVTEESNYIQYKYEVVFKILDAVLGNSRKKLKKGKSNYYLLDKNGCLFIKMILELYEEGDKSIKAFLEGRYDKVDDDVRELLYKGLCDLAKFKNNNVKKSYIDKRWNYLFNLRYKEVIDAMEDLEIIVNLYVSLIKCFPQNDETFKLIEENIRACSENVVTLAKEKMQPSEKNYEYIEKIIKDAKEEKKKRSMRARKGWETRRRR